MAYCQVWVLKHIASTCLCHSFYLNGLVKIGEFKNSPEKKSKHNKQLKNEKKWAYDFRVGLLIPGESMYTDFF